MESLSLLELALISIPIFAGVIPAMVTAYVLYHEYQAKKNQTDLEPSD